MPFNRLCLRRANVLRMFPPLGRDVLVHAYVLACAYALRAH